MEGRSTQGAGGGRATRPPITVERTPTGYVLRDPALVRLAGIDAVPLPFTALARPATVVAHLRRLSPHREVRLAPRDGDPCDGPTQQTPDS